MLENLLASRLPLTGLAAYSLQFQDRPPDTHCLSKSIYPASTQQMLTTLSQASQSLLPAKGKAVRYSWVFECLRVHVALRVDGACLVLLVENNPSAQIARIQELLQDFVSFTESF